MRVLGPRGTLHLTHHLQEAFSADIAIRTADENLPAEGARIDAGEFESDGVIHDQDGLRIICFSTTQANPSFCTAIPAIATT